MKKRNVGIFIFDDAEVLDFAGPFEVFSVTSQLNNFEPFEVFTVAKENRPVRAVNGLNVVPDYSFNKHPKLDILIVSGGQGTRNLLNDEQSLDWISHVCKQSEYTLSICSATRLFAKLGLLEHRPFCTHHEVYDHVLELEPTAIQQRGKRFTQTTEKLYTSGGISAGIDLSFYLVEKLLGDTASKTTARYMEYRLTS